MSRSGAFWDRKARGYDARLPTKGPNYAARLARAWAVLPPPPEGALLDVGCATGEITLDLAPRCGSVLGIDVAPQMVELANAKAEERGVANASFRAIAPDDESLEPESFDVITCYSVFHLVDDWRGMVRRLHELLRPGGHVVNETPCLGDWGPWWRPILWGMRAARLAPAVGFIKVTELEAAFRDVGFEVVESTVHNPKNGQHNLLARKS